MYAITRRFVYAVELLVTALDKVELFGCFVFFLTPSLRAHQAVI